LLKREKDKFNARELRLEKAEQDRSNYWNIVNEAE
jgi:hypothetical protein